MADFITNKSVVRSKKALLEALLSLIFEKEYEKITITDICKKADVVRKTFYNNFASKDDIMRYLISLMFKELEKSINFNSFNLKNMLYPFFNFIMEHRKFLLLFYQRGLIRFTGECISTYVENEKFILIFAKKFVTPKAYKYLADYVSAVLVSVVETWIKNDFTESIDFLVEITESFFYNRVTDFSKNGDWFSILLNKI